MVSFRHRFAEGYLFRRGLRGVYGYSTTSSRARFTGCSTATDAAGARGSGGDGQRAADGGELNVDTGGGIHFHGDLLG